MEEDDAPSNENSLDNQDAESQYYTVSEGDNWDSLDARDFQNLTSGEFADVSESDTLDIGGNRLNSGQIVFLRKDVVKPKSKWWFNSRRPQQSDYPSSEGSGSVGYIAECSPAIMEQFHSLQKANASNSLTIHDSPPNVRRALNKVDESRANFPSHSVLERNAIQLRESIDPESSTLPESNCSSIVQAGPSSLTSSVIVNAYVEPPHTCNTPKETEDVQGSSTNECYAANRSASRVSKKKSVKKRSISVDNSPGKKLKRKKKSK